MSDKASIRGLMRARRKALAPEERASASAAVCGKLARMLFAPGEPGFVVRGGALAVYLASPEEIDLSALVRRALAAGVVVAAPRWDGRTYRLARLGSLDPGDLRRGPMGILEPTAEDDVAPDEVAVWIVPGLAFTREGARLGYGGGWYDRLLAGAAPDALKLGVAHGFQVVGELPAEPHDIRLSAIVDDNADGE